MQILWAMIIDSLEYILAGGALCLASLMMYLYARKFKKIEKKLAAISLICKEQTKHVDINKNQIQELHQASMGIGKKVLELEEVLESFNADVKEIQLQDPDAKLYSRAVKMVGLGADPDEIIHECELPKAEVELLIRLHRQETSLV